MKREEPLGSEPPPDESDPNKDLKTPHGLSEWPLPPPEKLHEPMPPRAERLHEPMPPPPEQLHEPMPEGWVPPPKPAPEVLTEPMPADVPPPNESAWGCTPMVIGIAVLIVGVLTGIAILVGGPFGDVAEDDPAPEQPGATAPVTGAGKTATPNDDAPAAAGDGSPAVPGPESVPQGSELFQGTSGGPIGHIAQDGQSRFLSLQRRGVGVGNEAIGEMSTTWKQDGEVLSFGADLKTGKNLGRYGINLFRNGTEYSAGCSIEVGQTKCAFPGNGAKLKDGDQLVIIIGEQGHIEEKGKFGVDWWFVFNPR